MLGVAIVPQSDLDAYGSSFRSLQLSQANLFRARGLLSGFHRFPIQLMEEIEGRRDTLLKVLNGTGVYFLTIEGRASVLLNTSNGIWQWVAPLIGCQCPPAPGLTVTLLRERPDLWDTIIDEDSLDRLHFIKGFMRYAGEHVLGVDCATGSVRGLLRQRGAGSWHRHQPVLRCGCPNKRSQRGVSR